MEPSAATEGQPASRPPHAPRPPAARREGLHAAAPAHKQVQGHERTTIQDITNRMGVTRSLFYHYFPDKDAVTYAVLDAYIADYLEALHYWNANRRPGDIEHALSSVVHLLRVALFEHDAFRAALASQENAALYLEFINRVADQTATYLIESTVRDYEARHEVRIEHRYETFYVLILGVIGYMRKHPDADDALVADLIAQTLHMDRGSTT